MMLLYHPFEGFTRVNEESLINNILVYQCFPHGPVNRLEVVGSTPSRLLSANYSVLLTVCFFDSQVAEISALSI